jgi:aerobic-type carbon monoxide dehydrogenase small subunit (CoxS/CutS family)
MNLNEMGNTVKKIMIAGAEVEVNVNDDVRTTLTRILNEKGIDSFTIIVDGVEVTSTDSLPVIFDGHTIEVERYVKAG